MNSKTGEEIHIYLLRRVRRAHVTPENAKLVYPARSEADFYKAYDPWVGISTAILLSLFFFAITVKYCIRYILRKWRMHQFYKRTPPDDTTIDEKFTTTELL
ncbi:unnamed protein product [Angiostrongylus costaricensis]|uniref:Small integral membrane protein 8 n=1 Tax=Angiostrongylus costaricensis TaxID=334426 RepID=A0A158PLQ6_ANGCS|nr:unnamed protein product [Angiostrongylus costaricensis]